MFWIISDTVLPVGVCQSFSTGFMAVDELTGWSQTKFKFQGTATMRWASNQSPYMVLCHVDCRKWAIIGHIKTDSNRAEPLSPTKGNPGGCSESTFSICFGMQKGFSQCCRNLYIYIYGDGWIMHIAITICRVYQMTTAWLLIQCGAP